MQKQVSGFSLIEMMVVVTIMGLVGGSGWTYLKSVNNRQELNQVKDEVVAALKSGRNYAVSRQLPPGYGAKLKYVSVAIGNSGPINVFPNIDSSSSYQTKADLPSTITITKNIPTNDTIRFWAYEGKLVGTTGVSLGVGNSVAITIRTITGLGETKTIIVDSLGKIDVK
jgi:prepilin-type N-terminal cleavage/methylation domain-containing protein